MCVQLVSTDGSSVSDSKSQGAGDSVHDLDVTSEKTPMQQTQPTNASARCVEAAAAAACCVRCCFQWQLRSLCSDAVRWAWGRASGLYNPSLEITNLCFWGLGRTCSKYRNRLVKEKLKVVVVLLRYPKPKPKPRFFAKTVRRRNLGFFHHNWRFLGSSAC